VVAHLTALFAFSDRRILAKVKKKKEMETRSRREDCFLMALFIQNDFS